MQGGKESLAQPHGCIRGITSPVSQRHRNGPVAGLDVMGRFPMEPRLGALYGAGNGLPVYVRKKRNFLFRLT